MDTKTDRRTFPRRAALAGLVGLGATAITVRQALTPEEESKDESQIVSTTTLELNGRTVHIRVQLQDQIDNDGTKLVAIGDTEDGSIEILVATFRGSTDRRTLENISSAKESGINTAIELIEDGTEQAAALEAPPASLDTRPKRTPGSSLSA